MTDNWRMAAATLTLAGGGAAYVTFRNNSFRFVIYSADVEGGGEKAGIVIERDGVMIEHYPCQPESVSDLGPDLFRQLGLPEDTEGFELP